MRTPAFLTVFLLACSKNQDAISPDLGGASVDGGSTNPADPSSITGADSNASGTRLKVRTISGVDGSKVFTGLYDSERNENCGFQKAADGKVRCLPTEGSVSGYFEDPGCTKPLVVTAKACGTPATALQATFTCASDYSSRVLSVGSAFTDPTMYVGSPTSCTGTPTTNTLLTANLFRTGSEIPAVSFVEGVEAHE